MPIISQQVISLSDGALWAFSMSPERNRFLGIASEDGALLWRDSSCRSSSGQVSSLFLLECLVGKWMRKGRRGALLGHSRIRFQYWDTEAVRTGPGTHR